MLVGDLVGGAQAEVPGLAGGDLNGGYGGLWGGHLGALVSEMPVVSGTQM